MDFFDFVFFGTLIALAGYGLVWPWLSDTEKDIWQ